MRTNSPRSDGPAQRMKRGQGGESRERRKKKELGHLCSSGNRGLE